MSHFVSVTTKIKDKESLIKALEALKTNWVIEDNKEPVHLYGYKGDKREQVANIVIRRQYVGSASNDVGFLLKEDGTYEAIISEFDSWALNKEFLNNLQQEYSKQVVLKFANSKNMSIREERLQDGRVQMKLTPKTQIKTRR